MRYVRFVHGLNLRDLFQKWGVLIANVCATFVVPFETRGKGDPHLWNPNFESLNEAGDLDVKHRADRMKGGKWSVGSQRS